MKLMYCPMCSNYLMSPCGESDCTCGWRQPSDNTDEDSYNKGYEDALRSIKINLDHFLKDVYAIEMIYDDVLPNGKPDIDRYEGESDCSKFIRENVLGYEEK